MNSVINGINVQQFAKGWWGEHAEGERLLEMLELPQYIIPFDVERFLKTQPVIIHCPNGEEAEVCFSKRDQFFEFTCSFKGKRRNMKLFREWETESLDMLLLFESYSVGECVRKILAGESII